jgi:hypothetical protein
MTATGVWVEFWGGPWDGEMRELEGDDGRPRAIVLGVVAGPFHGVYRPGETLELGVVRMLWRHLGSVDPSERAEAD